MLPYFTSRGSIVRTSLGTPVSNPAQHASVLTQLAREGSMQHGETGAV
jgi:hypothetical protein